MMVRNIVIALVFGALFTVQAQAQTPPPVPFAPLHIPTRSGEVILPNAVDKQNYDEYGFAAVRRAGDLVFISGVVVGRRVRPLRERDRRAQRLNAHDQRHTRGPAATRPEQKFYEAINVQQRLRVGIGSDHGFKAGEEFIVPLKADDQWHGASGFFSRACIMSIEKNGGLKARVQRCWKIGGV